MFVVVAGRLGGVSQFAATLGRSVAKITNISHGGDRDQISRQNCRLLPTRSPGRVRRFVRALS
jgi:hypothetical protein